MTNRYTNVPKSDNKPENVVIIRGGGDLASGTIHRLYRCGYRLLVLECEKPTAIRRMVSFCEAVYDGQSSVEGVLCRKVDSVEECEAVWKAGEIPLMADTEGTVLKKYRPAALIDAILAKKNLGTTREMADLTVGLGPGFVAGEDVDYVVETMRGHNLARIITKGAAMPNTGVPGIIGGFGKERVLHAPAAGEIHCISKIADIVEKDQVLAWIGDTPVRASLTGVLRGMIRDGFTVPKGMKIADIDPRKEQIDYEKYPVIAVVGGGGKTSLIYRLTDELIDKGKRVIITTTTHMAGESELPFARGGDAVRVKELLDKERYVIAAEDTGKYASLTDEKLEELRELCDVMLVEADGAKHHPVKVPEKWEPVIPRCADIVISVIGLDCLGQPISQSAYRMERTSEFLRKSLEAPITEEDIVKIATSICGLFKDVEERVYRVYLNKSDILKEKEPAEHIVEELERKNTVAAYGSLLEE